MDKNSQGYEAEIPVSKIFLDGTYGREIRTPWQSRIARNFTWIQCGRPVLSKRKGERYACIDGNHRIEAIREKFGNKQTVKCIVHEGMSVEDEAWLFSTLNVDSRKISPGEVFRAGLAANDPQTLRIRAILTERKIALGDVDHPRSSHVTGRVTNAVVAVQSLYKAGNLEDVLDILIAAWDGEPDMLGRTHLVSVSRFLRDWPDASQKRLIQVIQRSTPGKFHADVSTIRSALTDGAGVSGSGATVLRSYYNKGLGRKNRLDTK